jgi:hypothetical protein
VVRQRKFWGWGYEDAGPDEEQAIRIAHMVAERLGAGDLQFAPVPRIEDVELILSTRSPQLILPSRFCVSRRRCRVALW